MLTIGKNDLFEGEQILAEKTVIGSPQMKEIEYLPLLSRIIISSKCTIKSGSDTHYNPEYSLSAILQLSGNPTHSSITPFCMTPDYSASNASRHPT
jgi:hypothetical protein